MLQREWVVSSCNTLGMNIWIGLSRFNFQPRGRGVTECVGEKCSIITVIQMGKNLYLKTNCEVFIYLYTNAEKNSFTLEFNENAFSTNCM